MKEMDLLTEAIMRINAENTGPQIGDTFILEKGKSTARISWKRNGKTGYFLIGKKKRKVIWLEKAGTSRADFIEFILQSGAIAFEMQDLPESCSITLLSKEEVLPNLQNQVFLNLYQYGEKLKLSPGDVIEQVWYGSVGNGQTSGLQISRNNSPCWFFINNRFLLREMPIFFEKKNREAIALFCSLLVSSQGLGIKRIGPNEKFMIVEPATL